MTRSASLPDVNLLCPHESEDYKFLFEIFQPLFKLSEGNLLLE